MQTWVKGTVEANENCWYSHLMEGVCKDGFDFSDHIVLYSVQYIYISTIELAYIYEQPRRMKYVLSVVCATLIMLFSLRSIFFTALLFHTIVENIVALLVVITFVSLPLKVILES